MNIWTLLGIAATSDEREIRRAYARRLKLTRPEDDPAAFQALNEAYQTALRMAQYARADEPDEAEWSGPAEPAVEMAAPQPLEQGPQPAWERPATPQCTQTAHAHQVQPAAPEAEPAAWEHPVAALREEAWEHPVPFLRELPDPVALERQRRQERERARAEARAASEAAFELARRLWSDFASLSTVSPKWHLRKLADSEELQNLEVRDHFELFALQYCAAEACPDELREAIVSFYGWEDDDIFVRRRLPDAASEAFARLRAGRAHAALLARASSEPAVAALLADSAGRRFGSTLRRDFTVALQNEIGQIRAYQPELLHFKLKREVFEEWERRVQGRRYFLETALWSLVIGLFGLNLLADLLFNSWGLTVEPGIRVALCVVLGVGGGALLTLKRPLIRLQGNERIDWLLHDLRYRPRWQLGWIPVFALLSSLMFIPEPPAKFAWLLGTAMIGCALVAGFVNSVLFFRNYYVFVGIAALVYGFTLASNAYPGYGALTCAAGAFCGIQLLFRGGADLWSRMPSKTHLILPLRRVWLAGTVALVLGAEVSPLPLQLHAALCWLWILGGMLLSNPTVPPRAMVAGSLGLFSCLMMLRSLGSILGTSPLSMLFIPLFAVAIFMLVNIIRAQKNQHPFS